MVVYFFSLSFKESTASTCAINCSLSGIYVTYFDAKILLLRPPSAYWISTFPLSVRKINPIGGLSSSSLTSSSTHVDYINQEGAKLKLDYTDRSFMTDGVAQVFFSFCN